MASRRKAEELIVEGRISVNGKVVRELGTKVDPERDRIVVEGQQVRQVERGVLLFNKPAGVVTTMKDPHGRQTVGDFLTKKYRSYVPVGRLDFESTGLMIMTNDGDLADLLLHPRYGFQRTYEVKVEGAMPRETIQQLQRGVTLDDGPARANTTLIDSHGGTTTLQVVIGEGRNRIVRRMMEKVGYPVLELRRIAHGPFRLGRLRIGELKRLTQREYEFFKRRIESQKERSAPSEGREQSVPRPRPKRRRH